MRVTPHHALASLPWLAGAVPFLWIAAHGFPAGDDWQLELTRIAAYRQAWADDQWPPFWAPRLYAGYGSVLFLCYGQLFLALASAVSFAGSFAASFIGALALATGVAVWALQRMVSAAVGGDATDTRTASARVAVYVALLNPYLITDLCLRNAAAEYTALCLTPLALLGLWTRSSRAGVALSAGIAVVIVTHSLVALTLALLLSALALDALRRTHDRRNWLLPRAGGGLLGLALSAFFWWPLFEITPLIRREDLVTGKFSFHGQLQGLGEIFAFSNPYSPGSVPLLAAGAAVCAIGRGGRGSALWVLLLLFGALLALQTPAAYPLWEWLPGLAYFQFPWRFNGPLALVSALLASLSFAPLAAAWPARRRVLLELAILCLCLASAGLQLGRTHWASFQEVERFEQLLEPKAMARTLLTATVGDEYLPRAARRSAIMRPAAVAPVTAATDGLRIGIKTLEPRFMAFTVRAERTSELCLARWAFPFWRVRVDDEVQPISACASGVLRVQVPQGKHRVVCELRMPRARVYGLWISACALLTWIVWWRRARRVPAR